MKLSKENWLDSGLTLLAEKGPDSLKVDVMCKVLGMTKGSFYHHFANRDDFITQLLNHWKTSNTLNIIAEVDKLETPESRSHLLDSLAMEADVGPERAIRSWGQYNEQVKECVNEIDDARINYLTDLIASQIKDNSVNVSLIAKIAYAHFVGSQQLLGVVSMQDWADMSLLLRELVLGKKE